MAMTKSAQEKAREYGIAREAATLNQIRLEEAWLSGHAEAVREIAEWLEDGDYDSIAAALRERFGGGK